MTGERLLFVNLVAGDDAQRNSVLLAASIRTFAGRLANAPVKFLLPNGDSIKPRIEHKLRELDVELAPIEIPPEVTAFPLASFPYVAGQAEEEATDEADILVWLSSETMITREPSALQLPDDKFLGVRPVHHLLIGSRWDNPLDRFWSIVFSFCGVEQESIYPMTTVVDGVKIRPYFNAGLLVTRPKKGIFQNWRESFLAVYKLPELANLYKVDPRYKVFIHQAILTGVALSKLGQDGILELPSHYNYPLHLYTKDSTSSKPERLEDLTTFRFESTFRESNWRDWIPAGERLKDWVSGHLKDVEP